MGKKRANSHHEETQYSIRLEQRPGSSLTTAAQFQEVVTTVFKRVTASFHLDASVPVPPSPPPLRFEWKARVKSKGHKKKFSKVVREISKAHPHFTAEAHRSEHG